MLTERVQAFLSIDDFRKAFPMGRTALYDAIRRGEIASVTVGARRFIPASELNRLQQVAERTLRNDDTRAA